MIKAAIKRMKIEDILKEQNRGTSEPENQLLRPVLKGKKLRGYF